MIKDGYIFIESFDKEKDKLVINNKNDSVNMQKLNGKLVNFPTLTLEEITKKLEIMDEIKYKYKNKNLYILEKIKVYMGENETDEINFKEAYIIY
jgi:hypothetical protein